MSFIVDPSSINHSSIRSDIESWLNSKPDAEKWAVFFQSSAGQSLIDLISGLAAFFQYETIVARREAYIAYAQNRSSLIGSAQALGYSSYRGKNATVKLTITPASSGVWSKWEVIGTVKDRYLIVDSDTVYNAGSPTEVSCIIGEVLEETLISPSDRLNSFRFTTSGVSEDCRIYIDGTEVSWGVNVSDLLEGKFVLQSNPLGSVDAKYLNMLTFSTKYTTNSNIKLSWISLKNVDFAITDISLDEGQGALTGAVITSIYDGLEEASSIRVNAPLKNETQNAIRGRNDQAKIFKQLTTKCADAIGHDVSAAIIKIFYVLTDDLRLTDDEKTTILELFEGYRPHGLLPPIIADATRCLTKLKIEIVLAPKKSGNINSTITSILSSRMYSLGSTLSLYSIEDELEQQDFIKIARVSLTGNYWSAETQYEVGAIIKKNPDNGKVYRAERIIYISNSIEPVWPTVIDSTVIDNQIIWKAVPKNDTAGISPWSASTDYRELATVKPSVANGFIYMASGFINKSGTLEPSWPSLNGGSVNSLTGTKRSDNQIVWVARPQEGIISPWSASTNYKTGDLVIASNQAGSDTVGVMFQAYAFLGKSALSTPTFSTVLNQLVVDGSIEWKTIDPVADEYTLDTNQYFVLEYEVTVS